MVYNVFNNVFFTWFIMFVLHTKNRRAIIDKVIGDHFRQEARDIVYACISSLINIVCIYMNRT